jgi:hypothetical protein
MAFKKALFYEKMSKKIFLKVVDGHAFIKLSKLKDFQIRSIKRTKARRLCKYYRKRRYTSPVGSVKLFSGCVKKAKYRILMEYKKYPVWFETYLCGYHIKKLKHE